MRCGGYALHGLTQTALMMDAAMHDAAQPTACRCIFAALKGDFL